MPRIMCKRWSQVHRLSFTHLLDYRIRDAFYVPMSAVSIAIPHRLKFVWNLLLIAIDAQFFCNWQLLRMVLNWIKFCAMHIIAMLFMKFRQLHVLAVIIYINYAWQMNISNDSILLICFIVFASVTPTLGLEWTRHVGVKIRIEVGIGFKKDGSESGIFFLKNC